MDVTAEGKKTIYRCYHCGDRCDDSLVTDAEKHFCCDGCHLVHQLLEENNLCTYYELQENPGVSLKAKAFRGRYAFLDDPVNEQKLIRFTDGVITSAEFYLPQIHCSSCVWLLEHLYRLDPGIRSSRVDFIRKEILVEFDRTATSLRKVAESLAMVGYEPSLHLADLEKKRSYSPNRSRVYKIAVAGFCFSNIMLLSFPEYFSISDSSNAGMQKLFAFLNLSLSLPVLLYSGSEFYTSAYKSLRNRFLNIDAPIALAVFITFGRSLYEIVGGTGAGYLDSMTGIVFFMLIGRYFQDLTHGNLSFDRDFRSFFPISVTRISADGQQEIAVNELRVGDRFLVRSGEIIPCDSKLIHGQGSIDYSFVNGESVPIQKMAGDLIYAGGKQAGASIELVAEQEVSQSYLTQLWNNQAFRKEKTYSGSFIHTIARYFTGALLLIAAISFVYWLPSGIGPALNALTAVLIVACPCALLLSASFTNGSVMRVLSRHHFYLKNPEVIDELSRIDTIVFDKTGTITESRLRSVTFTGILEPEEEKMIASVAAQSGHPLSRSILHHLGKEDLPAVSDFHEIPGSGLSCITERHAVKMGSSLFVTGKPETNSDPRVYVELDGVVRGYFTFTTTFRPQLQRVAEQLSEHDYQLKLLSGDHRVDEGPLRQLLGSETTLVFEQTPGEKLEYIESLKKSGRHVLMVGDGLNDAGALQAAHAGIAVSDDTNNFTPACDAILAGRSFDQLPALLHMTRMARKVILWSFGISIFYNLIGLYYATTGQLHPVVAAILMPASSVTIVLFTTAAVWYFSRRAGLREALAKITDMDHFRG